VVLTSSIITGSPVANAVPQAEGTVTSTAAKYSRNGGAKPRWPTMRSAEVPESRICRSQASATLLAARMWRYA
jgi:hypothetical protein